MIWPEGWITDHDFEFCGDETDSNHAGYVIDHARVLLLDALGFYDYSSDGISEEDWKAHLRSCLEEHEIDPDTATRQTWADLLATVDLGIQLKDVADAKEDGEAYDFAMREWGWKHFRDRSIGSWYLRKEDWSRIRYGMEIACQDIGDDDEEMERPIIVSNRRGNRYSLTVREILEGEFPTWLEKDYTALQEAARENVRQLDLAGLRKCYGENLGD